MQRVYIDLSWLFLRNGVFDMLSVASLCGDGSPDDSLPFWAVNWSGYNRAVRAQFDKVLQMPTNIAEFRKARAVSFRRNGNAVVMQGRLLEHPIRSVLSPTGGSTS